MKNLLYILFLFFIPAVIIALPPADPPEINAASAIMMDAVTGSVLYEKNADALIPPASMTKLMTIHVALKYIHEGRADEKDFVPISKSADFRSLPPRSSLMFIEQGQKVTLFELLMGLALPSGNDAGIALAEYLAGSVEDFVEQMNAEASRLGLLRTHFADSSGLSENNITTAREYALFCRYYIDQNAEYMQKLHQAESFTYPKEENLPQNGSSVHGPITQYNHNTLIGRMASVDGLKTGYIDESGYNLAATAEQNGRRLVLVTMGGPGRGANDGSIRRALDAAVLFSYGFYAWTSYIPEVPKDTTIKIYGGKSNTLRLSYSPAAELLIETSAVDQLEFIPVFYEFNLPVTEGQTIGKWNLVRNGEIILQSGIITAAESVEIGNLFKRIVDSFRQ